MILVDTDVLIWILRGKKEVVEKFRKLVVQHNGLIFITPVQVAEIYAGLREKEKDKVISFLQSLRTIIIDYEIGKLAGEFMNKYKKSHNLTLADSLIAASAKIHSCKLWTLNKKHYPMFRPEALIE